MVRERRRYTTVAQQRDWIVSASWDDSALARTHWFEANVAAVAEDDGSSFALPPEIATYRVGEIEHPFREIVRIDWAGDREAAIRHTLDSLFRRVYAYIERGH
ncbi:MAG: hypothetical protein ACKO5K_15475 [Armatimonadota bacterium]